MANFISIKTDIDETQKALEKTAKSASSISLSALRIVAKDGVKVIKAAIKSSGLKKRSGELLKCYGYRKSKKGNSIVIYPKALNGESSIFPKVMALSYGTDKRQNRKLKAFGFVQAGQKAIENKNYKSQIEEMIAKELQKYWG